MSLALIAGSRAELAQGLRALAVEVMASREPLHERIGMVGRLFHAAEALEPLASPHGPSAVRRAPVPQPTTVIARAARVLALVTTTTDSDSERVAVTQTATPAAEEITCPS
jgi:hypothetical protein